MLENNYVEKFLRMRCSADILGILNPFGSGVCKEITEAMTIFSKIKDITLNNKLQYNVIELCSGNPLPSVLSAFALPITHSIAIDKRLIGRKYELIRKFKYIQLNIFDDEVYNYIDNKSILIASHACKNLSVRIIEIFNNSDAFYLCLIPCCTGNIDYLKFPQAHFIRKKLGNYRAWSTYLATLCHGNLCEDNKCLSPKNIIITAKKDEKCQT